MIPNSFCSPELLAHIAYEKYVMGTPLHRLEKDFAAKNVLFYSLAATASANNLPVEQYFTLVLSSLPKLKANKETLLALLPYNRDI